MTSPRDPDQLIHAFLDEGMSELPDRAYDEVRADIEHTRQRFVLGPWREQQMTRFATLGIAAAAIVIAVVVGVRYLPGDGGVGVAPAKPTPATATPAPTAEPTAEPTLSSSPVADPNGPLDPGTYVAHPFNYPIDGDGRAFTFTVATRSWEAMGDPNQTFGVAWIGDGNDDSGGVAIGFLKVDSLNADACQWSDSGDEISVGKTVDDFFAALESSTQFDPGQGPYTEYVSNAMGQGTEITMPNPLPSAGCDEGAYRIWNATGMDIYAQGPSNVWRLGVFDVDGERYIVMASYMPDTSEEVRGEMMDIFRSVVIDSN